MSDCHLRKPSLNKSVVLFTFNILGKLFVGKYLCSDQRLPPVHVLRIFWCFFVVFLFCFFFCSAVSINTTHKTLHNSETNHHTEVNISTISLTKKFTHLIQITQRQKKKTKTKKAHTIKVMPD